MSRVPRSNWLGLPAGTYTFAFKARMVILSPLTPGSHTISTVAHFTNPDDTLGMTYHLTVR